MAGKSFSFKAKNTASISKMLARKKKKMFNAIQTGLTVGIRRFGGQVIKEQMSGRGQGDIFLNAPTGSLRRSWFVIRDFLGSGGFKVRWATTSKYAAIHQFGGITGAHGSVIPKRLFILERFQATGKRLVMVVVRKKLREATL